MASKTFRALAEYYLKRCERSLRPNTIRLEKTCFSHLLPVFGDCPAREIKPSDMAAYQGERLEVVKPQTVNLEIAALKRCLRYAIRTGFVGSIPAPVLLFQPLKSKPKRRSLLTASEIDNLVNDCMEAGRTSLANYIRFLQFTGCREREALRLTWEDVNWNLKQVIIGADGSNKNGKVRYVDFSPPLEELLERMRFRSDCKFLFPAEKSHWKRMRRFQNTLSRIRPHFGGFHRLRHYFISQAVMSGVDYRTIAEWVGHSDGGVLIGRVYSHLNAAHRQAAAAKLRLV